MVPTKIDRSSWIDRELPIRVYGIDPDKTRKAVRLTYRHGLNEYWGVQMTDWEDAPVLAGRNFARKLGGRTYELYYNGPRLHMVVLQDRRSVVLGRQHAARPALERDDDRDRQEPPSARQPQVDLAGLSCRRDERERPADSRLRRRATSGS